MRYQPESDTLSLDTMFISKSINKYTNNRVNVKIQSDKCNVIFTYTLWLPCQASANGHNKKLVGIIVISDIMISLELPRILPQDLCWNWRMK